MTDTSNEDIRQTLEDLADQVVDRVMQELQRLLDEFETRVLAKIDELRSS